MPMVKEIDCWTYATTERIREERLDAGGGGKDQEEDGGEGRAKGEGNQERERMGKEG